MANISLPSNFPALFAPHFFPQLAAEGNTEELQSIQWQQSTEDQTWSPIIWASRCTFSEGLVFRKPYSEVKFKGLYISASKALTRVSRIDQKPAADLTED